MGVRSRSSTLSGRRSLSSSAVGNCWGQAETAMLRVGSVRWKGKCARHPGYDPQNDGIGGSRGGRERCSFLLEIYTHHQKLVSLMRQFGSREERPKVAPAEAAED